MSKFINFMKKAIWVLYISGMIEGVAIAILTMVIFPNFSVESLVDLFFITMCGPPLYALRLFL